MLGVIQIGVVRPSAVARVISALVFPASPRHSIGAAAQPAVPADRCAHKIVCILTDCAARLRQLNGIPVRHPWQRECHSFFDLDVASRASGTRVVHFPSCQRSLCRVWYERPLCWKLVVLVWYERPLCGRHVEENVIPEGRGSRSTPVVPRVIVYWAWFQIDAGCAGVIP